MTILPDGETVNRFNYRRTCNPFYIILQYDKHHCYINIARMLARVEKNCPLKMSPCHDALHRTYIAGFTRAAISGRAWDTGGATEQAEERGIRKLCSDAACRQAILGID